ncbi:MAG: GatB/YqeY domain-containing protein [Rhodobacteraceae bacterium]|nr:GatB/YqeY domain-containing protein [Paracoccaceae bacterium]
MTTPIRAKIAELLKSAESTQDRECRALLKLINAAIVDRDSVAQSHGSEGVDDQDIIALLADMKMQRERSSSRFDEQGHIDLAARERKEIALIDSLLPQLLTPAEVSEAVDRVIARIKASGIRDKGRVIHALRDRYPNQIAYDTIGQLVVSKLCRDSETQAG